MKATKKTLVQSREAEIIDAIRALAAEKDISEDMRGIRYCCAERENWRICTVCRW